jgi:HAD superfamily hydrolase (TIGR01509 family)
VVANLSRSRIRFPVKAVAFDLDDTLFDRRTALALLLEKWAGGKPEPDLLVRMSLAPRDEFFVKLTRLASPAVEPCHVEPRFRAEFPGCVRADEDALAVLRFLRDAELRLGLLSNGSPGMQLAKLKACGAHRFFPPRRCLFSGSLGIAKPDARAFQILAARLGVEPEEVLFVGDDPLRDIAGATAAGMRACQLVRPGREKVAAAMSIASLAELPPLLTALA